MTYDAKAIKVMIASPSDVPNERKIARAVISRWNDINSEDRRMVLMPIGWETHAAPEMGERPQAIINKQILKGCDILIAVFWTRIGSPTGAAISGTVEEIEEHITAGKPAMLYFSTAPVEMGSVDFDQYKALKQFEASCRDRGLAETYDSLADFEEKLFRQLSHTIIRKFAEGKDATIASPPTPPEIVPLTDQAKELLLEASQDSNGLILRLRTMDGLSIEANSRNFAQGANARGEATWERALRELESAGYLSAQGNKGEVFQVTDEGYKAADAIRDFRKRTQEPSADPRKQRDQLLSAYAKYKADGFFNNLFRRAGIPGTDLIEAITNARTLDDLLMQIDARSRTIGIGKALLDHFKNPEAFVALNKMRAELERPPLDPPAV